jgi:tetratricopeptide (TPR) repeat protein
MFPYLRATARWLTAPFRAARRRPRLALGLTALLLVAAGAAGFWYVHSQWEAAQTALAEGRPAEARSRLEVCLLVWPRDPEVHRLAARAARIAGDVQAAETHLNRCLKLHGGATQAVQIEFLLLRAQLGEVDEVASTLLDSVEKGHPDSPLILETMAGAYIVRLRYRPAHACLSRWIELQPNIARPYQLRGWVLERMNQNKAAAQDYDRALELAPDLVPVRLRVAEMLLEDKRVPDALPHLERLHRQLPDHPEVQARLGICRFYQNRTEEARRLMEAAVPRLARDPSLLIHLARLDLQQGQAAQAERRLRAVLRADPHDTEALYTLVSVQQFLGRTGEAAATLKEYEQCKERVNRTNQLLREVADRPTAKAADYAELGDLLLQIGRERQGLYWLEHALERNPAQLRAHQALATHYERKGDHERAAAHRRWVPERTETNPKAEIRNPKSEIRNKSE